MFNPHMGNGNPLRAPLTNHHEFRGTTRREMGQNIHYKYSPAIILWSFFKQINFPPRVHPARGVPNWILKRKKITIRKDKRFKNFFATGAFIITLLHFNLNIDKRSKNFARTFGARVSPYYYLCNGLVSSSS